MRVPIRIPLLVDYCIPLAVVLDAVGRLCVLVCEDADSGVPLIGNVNRQDADVLAVRVTAPNSDTLVRLERPAVASTTSLAMVCKPVQ